MNSAERRNAVTIWIKSTLRKREPAVANIRASLRKLLSNAGLPGAEVSVLLVGDRSMRTLNHRYRGKDRTTDVLSFPLRGGKHAMVQPGLLGDIVICVPAAARQARELGETLRSEVERLLVHGFLHLLGYDHERSASAARRMEIRERRLRETLRR